MAEIARYLREPVRAYLAEKMVFVGGARQVGKTTFAQTFLGTAASASPAYLNWDNTKTRAALIRGESPPRQPLIVLDEIHKYARWRNLVKGFYDTYGATTSFLITGSARLDFYRKGGDSLQGRYHYYRLHPFSPAEIEATPSAAGVSQLLRFGGFPEPFLRANERAWRRWQRERQARVIYDDVRDLENVREISVLRDQCEPMLFSVFPDREVISTRKTDRSNVLGSGE